MKLFEPLVETEDGSSVKNNIYERLPPRNLKGKVKEDEECFATEKIEKMNDFEGLDYWPPKNEAQEDTPEVASDEHLRAKWLCFAFIGLCLALVSFTMKQSIEGIILAREDLVADIVLHGTVHEEVDISMSQPSVQQPIVTSPPVSKETFVANCTTPDNEECTCTPPEPTVTMPATVNHRIVPTINYVKGWAFWAGSSCLLVLIASCIVVFIEPAASSSGLPEVMAYLNGIQLKKGLGRRVVVCKYLSCLFAVASGLPVGPEGPMIHLGAMVGAILTQSKDSSFGFRRRFISEGANRKFRSTRERRDFIACGAAAGVSAAFGAPMGGLLFVMEEVATYWDTSLTWLIFFGTMIAFFFSALLMSLFHGWKPTGHVFGELTQTAQVLFQPLVLARVEVHILIIIPAVVIGVICGFLAVLFTKINLRIAGWRRRVIAPNKYLRVIEPFFLALVYGTVTFVIPMFAHCRSNYSAHSGPATPGEIEAEGAFIGFHCDSQSEMSPLATLTMNSGETVIKHLFSKGTSASFPGGTVFVYMLLYFCFSAYAAGNTYASGVVIPILVIGSATGRTLGEIARSVLPNVVGNVDFIDPGTFALLGAAAFFAGVSRLTVSLAVIMVELSNELYWLPAMMCSIIIAKWVADYYSHSLYHAIIKMNNMPFLDSQHVQAPHLSNHTALEVATHPVVVVYEEEEMSVLIDILKTRHNGFPVVAEDGRLIGIIMRIQIEMLVLAQIQKIDLSCGLNPDTEMARGLIEAAEPRGNTDDRLASLLQTCSLLSNAQLEKIISCRRYYSKCPFFVNKDFRLSLAFIMFQSLGLRHLIVVNSRQQVIGMITRKDLCCVDDRLKQRNLLETETLSPQHRRRLEHTHGGSFFEGALVRKKSKRKKSSAGVVIPTESVDSDSSDDGSPQFRPALATASMGVPPSKYSQNNTTLPLQSILNPTTSFQLPNRRPSAALQSLANTSANGFGYHTQSVGSDSPQTDYLTRAQIKTARSDSGSPGTSPARKNMLENPQQGVFSNATLLPTLGGSQKAGILTSDSGGLGLQSQQNGVLLPSLDPQQPLEDDQRLAFLLGEKTKRTTTISNENIRLQQELDEAYRELEFQQLQTDSRNPLLQ